MLMTSFRPLINGKLAIAEVIYFGIAFDFWTVFSQNYSWVTPGEKQKQLKKNLLAHHTDLETSQRPYKTPLLGKNMYSPTNWHVFAGGSHTNESSFQADSHSFLQFKRRTPTCVETLTI